jgi:hypothetical protein
MELDNLKALITHEMPNKSKKSNQPEFGVSCFLILNTDFYNLYHEIDDQTKLLRSSRIQFMGSKD